MSLEAMRYVVTLRSGHRYRCLLCAFAGQTDAGADSLLNHYVGAHDFNLLHVGAECETNSPMEVLTSTAYVLGTADPAIAEAINLEQRKRWQLDDPRRI